MTENDGVILGYLIAVVLLLAIFFPNVLGSIFKISMIIILILALVGAYFYFTVGKPEQETRDKNTRKRKAVNEELERITKKKIRAKAVSLSLLDSDIGKISALPLVEAVFNKYQLALRNDYNKFLSPDGYGRISSEQEEEWKWHLIEVVDSCKLDKKADELRSSLKQLILSQSIGNKIVGTLNDDKMWELYEKEFSNVPETIKIISFEKFEEDYLNKFNHSKSGKYSERSLDIERYHALSKAEKKSKRYMLTDLVKYRNLVFESFENVIHSSPALEFDADMSGLDYEHYCAKLLDKVGWTTTVLPATGDHGADIIAEKDSNSCVIQCKKYSKPLGNTPIQEVTAAKAHYSAEFAIVVTNSTYTKNAQILAKSNGVRLLHHDDLFDLENLL